MKVMIEFDSQTKEASVKIDGNEVVDFESVTVAKDYYSKDGKHYLYLSTRKEDTDEKFVKYTSIQASKEDSTKFEFIQKEREPSYEKGIANLLGRE